MFVTSSPVDVECAIVDGHVGVESTSDATSSREDMLLESFSLHTLWNDSLSWKRGDDELELRIDQANKGKNLSFFVYPIWNRSGDEEIIVPHSLSLSLPRPSLSPALSPPLSRPLSLSLPPPSLSFSLSPALPPPSLSFSLPLSPLGRLDCPVISPTFLPLYSGMLFTSMAGWYWPDKEGTFWHLIGFLYPKSPPYGDF